MIETLCGALATPIRQEAEGRFIGGLYGAGTLYQSFARSLDATIQHPEAELPNNAPVIEEPALYVGVLFNHLGHFLTESIGQLWACELPDYAGLPIYAHPMWGVPDIASGHAFTRVVLEAFGVDMRRLRFITAPTRFSRLFVPERLYAPHLMEAPQATFLASLGIAEKRLTEERLEPIYRQHEPARNVYISRSRWHASRGPTAGEAEFEAFLANFGWSILHPQEVSFVEQLAAYAAAERLIFADGSAYHSLIMLPTLRAKVAVILRRVYAGGVVPQFKGLGLSDNLHTIGHVKRTYPFGMPDYCAMALVDYHAVSRELRDIGFVPDEFTNWPEIERHVLDRDLAKYIASVKDDPRFIE